MNQSNQNIKLARIATIPESVTHIIDSIIEFKKNGYNVDLICSKADYGEYLRKHYGINVIYCDIARNISIINDIKAVFKLARIFFRNNYDIVHSNTPKAGLVSALAGILSARKIRLHTFTGQRWATLHGRFKTLLMWIDKLIINLNTKCFADSPSQVRFLEDCGVARKNKVICLGLGSFGGVNLSIFNNQNRDECRLLIAKEFNIPADYCWMLYVGRIVKDKGIEELVRAFLPARQVAKVQLLLVGDYEEALDPISSEIKTIIEKHVDIHFLGFQKKPAQFMAASDFLCLPSYREGFGGVVIEAAACGIPAIGTNIPGLSDAIVDGQTGVLVPVRKVEPLGKAIVEMCNDSKMRLQLGESAKTRAEANFSSKVIANHQMKEYQKMLDRA